MDLEVQGVTDLVILNGPEIGKTLPIGEGVSYLGRSPDGDIRIEDETISRNHLKIESIKGRHFVTDLSSRNGTFYEGKYVVPGHEVEIKEGVPLAIGMSVICFGGGYRKQEVPFMDTVSLIRKKGKKDGVSEDQRLAIEHKREDLLSGVSLALKENNVLKVALGKVLEHIFYHLKGVDRGAFVLADPDTLRISETIGRVNKSGKDTIASFSEGVVQAVLKRGKPLILTKGYPEERNGFFDTLELHKIQSLMCAPLNNGSRIMGAMYVDSLKRPDGFSDDDLLILLDIAQRVALAVETDRVALDQAKAAGGLGSDVED
jgi:pSer/pThr/pTyr-binding forkhead associated (FHA) protein